LGDIEIRGYLPRDLDGCRRLWEELTLEHRQIYGDPNIGGDDPGSHFDKHLTITGPEHLVVAVDKGTVVGLGGYIMMEGEAEVEPLVVSAKYRMKGIGSRLLKAIVEQLEGTGIRFLNVRPVMRNRKAFEFFRHKGFDKVGRVELFIDYTGRDWKKDLKLFDMDFEY